MKGLLLAAGFVMSGSVLASGFYAGGQAGGISTSVDIDYPLFASDHGGSNGIVGIYAGYSMHMDGFNIGIEFDYNFGETKSESKYLNALDINYTVQNNYGVSFLVGVPMGEKFDVYGRVGYARSHVKMEAGLVNTESDDTTESINGMVFGLGSSYKIEENLTLRMDYRFINYSKVDIAEIADQTLDAKVSEQAFTVGIHYHF